MGFWLQEFFMALATTTRCCDRVVVRAMSRPDNTAFDRHPQTKPIAMSIVVNLPDELGRTIAAEAAKAGMTVSDYVADRLAKATAGTATGETKVRLIGAALVQRWRDLGLIGYRSDITDPEAHSRRLREEALRRASA